MAKIVASIMCGNQMNLEKELKELRVAGIDWLHCDIMDGIFVNNLAMAPYVLEPIIQAGQFTTDLHLACISPEKYVEMFASIQPNYLTFHVEATENVTRVINQIHQLGIKAGLAVSPETDITVIFPYLAKVDLVLMMTVNPGFSGQIFQYEVLNKLKLLNKELKRQKVSPLVEVDGNIHAETAALIRQTGADLYVVGTSALFNDKTESYQEKVATMLKAIGEVTNI